MNQSYPVSESSLSTPASGVNPAPVVPTAERVWRKPPQLRRFYEDEGEGERHATWLELFYDLVFVIAIAELAGVLHHDPTIIGVLSFLALFVPVWWSWMGFTFYADQFDSDDVIFRVTLLTAMLATLGMAISIHLVLEGQSTSFAVSYIIQRLLLIAMFFRARLHATEARDLCTRFIIGYTLGVSLWIASLFVPAPWRFVVWAVALFVEITTPIIAVRTMSRMPVHPSHIPERFGLFTLIVLGESVVAVAVATADTEWQFISGLMAATGFAIVACLWWIYFDFVDSSVIRRGALPSFLFGYGHLAIFATLTALGVGTEMAIEHATEAVLPLSTRAVFCGSTAAYLVAMSGIHLLTRRSLHDSVLTARLGVAAIVLSLIVIGGYVSPLVLSALLLVPMIALTGFEIVQFQQHVPNTETSTSVS